VEEVRNVSEKSEDAVREWAREMARLSLEFARKTNYEWILLPAPLPLAAMPFPLKWLPKLQEALKKEVK
jgi:hypothetical protein